MPATAASGAATTVDACWPLIATSRRRAVRRPQRLPPRYVAPPRPAQGRTSCDPRVSASAHRGRPGCTARHGRHHRGMDSPPFGPGLAAAPETARRAARTVAGRVQPRHRFVLARSRIRESWWGIVQSAVGGAAAWELAVRLLGHPAPFFASVAAIVCLSTSYVNRLRRVVEVSIGVALGVGLGDLLVGVIGRGAAQLGFTVLIAMTAALLLDGGAMLVNQAALQAVFVVALPPPTGGYVGRWEDAALGGLVALVVAFTAPADPRPGLRRASAEVLTTVSHALREAAEAARTGDADGAYEALELARSTDTPLQNWRGALQAAQDITLLTPRVRSGKRGAVAHEQSIGAVNRGIRNLRVGLRRVVALVEARDGRGLPDGDPLVV